MAGTWREWHLKENKESICRIHNQDVRECRKKLPVEKPLNKAFPQRRSQIFVLQSLFWKRIEMSLGARTQCGQCLLNTWVMPGKTNLLQVCSKAKQTCSRSAHSNIIKLSSSTRIWCKVTVLYQAKCFKRRRCVLLSVLPVLATLFPWGCELFLFIRALSWRK